MVREELSHRFFCDRTRRRTVERVRDEERDVALSCAKRRDVDLEDRQSVVQVFAQLPAFEHTARE